MSSLKLFFCLTQQNLSPPPKKNTEDNFYEVRTTKCTKTLYQTDNIRRAVYTAVYTALVYTALQCTVYITLVFAALQCTVYITLVYAALQCTVYITLVYAALQCTVYITLVYTALQCTVYITLVYTTLLCTVYITLVYTTMQCILQCTLNTSVQCSAAVAGPPALLSRTMSRSGLRLCCIVVRYCILVRCAVMLCSTMQYRIAL